MVGFDAAREVDGKGERVFTPPDIVLNLNFRNSARFFVANKIYASKYPIHLQRILSGGVLLAKRKLSACPMPEQAGGQDHLLGSIIVAEVTFEDRFESTQPPRRGR